MFEVGKFYDVKMLDGPLETIGTTTMKVTAVNLPLVTFDNFGAALIVNTSAPTFVSAALDPRIKG